MHLHSGSKDATGEFLVQELVDVAHSLSQIIYSFLNLRNPRNLRFLFFLRSIDDALDEHADGRLVVFDQGAGADAVGADKDFGVQTGAKGVDGHEWRADGAANPIDLLTEHQPAAFQ